MCLATGEAVSSRIYMKCCVFNTIQLHRGKVNEQTNWFRCHFKSIRNRISISLHHPR